MAVMACIDDLRERAKKRVPRHFFDYVEAGSYSEGTLKRNRSDLEKIGIRQRVMRDVANRDLSTTLLGEKLTMPVVLAPVGSLGLQWANGEILACRAAEAVGVPFTLSTFSILSIEDVAAEAKKPFWFQLYVMKDRGFIRALLERAAAAGCSALVLTVDLQVLGQRHCDERNGLSVPPRFDASFLKELALKLPWAIRMLRAKRRTFGNLHGHLPGAESVGELAEWSLTQFDQSLSWRDVEWIKGLWSKKLVIKGVLEPDDARAAVASGADVIVVSNHGGRQLDGAPSSISALPKIAEAVGDKTEVLMDGGVRTGQDIFRALALGAKAAMIGRAYVYGLGAEGERGVTKALGFLRKELDVTMALAGVKSVSEITRDALAE